MEDNFSIDGGGGDGSGGNVSDGERWRAAEALLPRRCSPPAVRAIPNRPRIGTRLRPGG